MTSFATIMSAVVLIPAPFYGDYPTTYSHLTLVWPGGETSVATMNFEAKLRGCP